jgi:hypothetical protein
MASNGFNYFVNLILCARTLKNPILTTKLKITKTKTTPNRQKVRRKRVKNRKNKEKKKRKKLLFQLHKLSTFLAHRLRLFARRIQQTIIHKPIVNLYTATSRGRTSMRPTQPCKMTTTSTTLRHNRIMLQQPPATERRDLKYSTEH